MLLPFVGKLLILTVVCGLTFYQAYLLSNKIEN